MFAIWILRGRRHFLGCLLDLKGTISRKHLHIDISFIVSMIDHVFTIVPLTLPLQLRGLHFLHQYLKDFQRKYRKWLPYFRVPSNVKLYEEY